MTQLPIVMAAAVVEKPPADVRAPGLDDTE
jgi:hypothetical protein